MAAPPLTKDKDKDKDKEPVLDFSRPILGEGIITNVPPAGAEGDKEVDEGGGLDFSRPITGAGVKTNIFSPEELKRTYEPEGEVEVDELGRVMTEFYEPAPVVQRQSLRLKQPLPGEPLVDLPKFLPQEQAKATRATVRRLGAGGVKRRVTEQLRPYQESLATGGGMGGAMAGMKVGEAAGTIWPGGPVGRHAGGGLGAILGGGMGYMLTKPVVGLGYATPGEIYREMMYSMVPPAVRMGRGIIPTIFKEAGKVVLINEAALEGQSLLDEGHTLSLRPGDVVERNLLAAGLGGFLGGLAGGKVRPGQLKKSTAAAKRTLEIQMEILEAKYSRKAPMKRKVSDKAKAERKRWAEKGRELQAQAKEDYDFFLKNVHMFSDPLLMNTPQAVRISQRLAQGLKKRDYWNRQIERAKGKLDVHESVLIGAAKVNPRVAGATTDLKKVYEHFEAPPEIGFFEKQWKKVQELPDKARTSLLSKYRPLQALEENIRKAYGMAKKVKHDIAAKFEMLPGSYAKARGHMLLFDDEVVDRVKSLEKTPRKGGHAPGAKSAADNEADFNAYMFLHRTLDRLRAGQRVRGKIKGLEDEIKEWEKVPKKERTPAENKYIKARKAELSVTRKATQKQVGEYELEQTKKLILEFREAMGAERYAILAEAGLGFQKHLGRAMMRQVESGRLSKAGYKRIKDDTGFYAPFGNREFEEIVEESAASMKPIDSTKAYAEYIKGITDREFKLVSILEKGREKIFLSTLSSQKNLRMRELKGILDLDVENKFARRLREGESPRGSGTDTIKVMEDGKVVRYEVAEDVAAPINAVGGHLGGDFVEATLATAGTQFKLGATAWNIPFQLANIAADLPSAAILSDYGIKGPIDALYFTGTWVRALHTALTGNVGRGNKLYRQALEAGVLRNSMGSMINPKSVQMYRKIGEGRGVVETLSGFTNAIEESFKIAGVERAIKLHGAKNVKELIQRNPEAITEIRRFMGSPDFARAGSGINTANLLFMFLNARIQGAARDLNRVSMHNKKGLIAFSKMTALVGTPTVINHIRNKTLYAEDLEKTPRWEKDNYYILFHPTRFVERIMEDGSVMKVRDSWKIPKRGVVQLFANGVEGMLDFEEDRNPAAFAAMAGRLLDAASPVSIGGDTGDERLESILSSLNPLLKVPLELSHPRGYSTFKHRYLMPEYMARSEPREQYVAERTPQMWINLAHFADDKASWLPSAFRSPIKLQALTEGMTAGLIKQFIPKEEVEGRPDWMNSYIIGTLGSRFLSSGYTEDKWRDETIKRLRRLSSTETVIGIREAKKFIKERRGKTIKEIKADVEAKWPLRDARGIEYEEFWRNFTMQNRVKGKLWEYVHGIKHDHKAIKALPHKERATFILDKIEQFPVLRSADGTEYSQLGRDMLIEYDDAGVITKETFKHIVLQQRERALRKARGEGKD